MKRIMLTGAAGYLGQAIYQMGRDDYEWVLFDWRLPETTYHTNLDWVLGDILDCNALEQASIGCDMIIHTAALHTKKME